MSNLWVLFFTKQLTAEQLTYLWAAGEGGRAGVRLRGLIVNSTPKAGL